MCSNAKPRRKHISREAKCYVISALDIMQSYSLRTKEIDWLGLRKKVLTKAAGAQTMADTYSAIRYAINCLGDKHSHLILPEVRNKENFEKEATDYLPVVEHEIVDPYSEFPIAYLRIPGYYSPLIDYEDELNKEMATNIQTAIHVLQREEPYGWIVDLRNNRGGNMWPMLCGIGPLLGDDRVGAFKSSKSTLSWHYSDGSVWVEGNCKKRVKLDIGSEIASKVSKNMPIAILINGDTVSSGEAIAIAFLGRDNLETFGEPSRGLSTGNAPFKLCDGAIINLTTSIFVDRIGNLYPNGIKPTFADSDSKKRAQLWIKECII